MNGLTAAAAASGGDAAGWSNRNHCRGCRKPLGRVIHVDSMYACAHAGLREDPAIPVLTELSIPHPIAPFNIQFIMYTEAFKELARKIIISINVGVYSFISLSTNRSSYNRCKANFRIIQYNHRCKKNVYPKNKKR